VDRDDEMLNYVQNRLTGDRRAAFEAEMQTDPQLASEVKVMQAVRVELSPPANDNRAPIRQLFQMASAAVLAVGVWHFGVAPSLNSGGPYETVSEEAGGPVLQVVFAGTASLGDVTALLEQFEGQIIAGPTALGVYRVEFADTALRDAALTELAERSDLVSDVFAQ